MQVKKEEIRKKILDVAREEFIQNGFIGTSMRTIAKKSKISTSNIYNYFKNKDDLFAEILKSTISKIKEGIKALENLRVTGENDFWSFEFSKKQFDLLMQFVHKNREDLDLILFKSHGSSIQDFKDEVIEKYTDLNMKHLEFLGKIHPEMNTNLSRFFIHNVSSFYANIINEIIMHNISYEKMKKYSEEIITFVYFGYKELMKLADGL